MTIAAPQEPVVDTIEPLHPDPTVTAADLHDDAVDGYIRDLRAALTSLDHAAGLMTRAPIHPALSWADQTMANVADDAAETVRDMLRRLDNGEV